MADLGAAPKLEVGQLVPPQAKKSHGGARPQKQEFAAATAALTGESKRQINRQLAISRALGDDLQRVAGTCLDKGVELQALAKLPERQRKQLVQQAVANCARISSTVAEVAQLLNASTRSVAAAAKVLHQGDPSLIEAVERGEVAVSTAVGAATPAG